MSIPAEPSLLQDEVQVFNAKLCELLSGPAGDNLSRAFTLQICLVIALSFRCRCWRLGFVNGQVKLYTWPCVLKERWREKRTGISYLNFFQAVIICVVVESSQPPAAESMFPR